MVGVPQNHCTPACAGIQRSLLAPPPQIPPERVSVRFRAFNPVPTSTLMASVNRSSSRSCSSCFVVATYRTLPCPGNRAERCCLLTSFHARNVRRILDRDSMLPKKSLTKASENQTQRQPGRFLSLCHSNFQVGRLYQDRVPGDHSHFSYDREC